ncbi:hypothetical protein Ais01nite_39420 [Asanoa ishikariensis]|uniref:Uncharacterized protein n=1 Tax=Asanoa ishikariensis TaxID=137265 RepID=A0A1H3M5T4_9ACTN|nr:hypothetical protein [Asanoa ishikariensis]GIF65907.1 hypothetical protein Ais01nite_39420 [Asanoa ishikariensis]SDY71608.1 hypothetical protein SAMN05421684_1182 [Asanoa ishikariensis]
MTELEGHYRRLLALFPRRHRQAYEAEMLDALLAGARPGQRRPRAGEVLDLARAALTAHVAGRSTWSAAAGVVGAIGMAASALRGAGVLHTTLVQPDWTFAVTVLGWLLAAAGSVAGWRVLAVTAATVGLVMQATFSFLAFGVDHLPIAVVAALLTAGCLAVWAITDGPVFRGRALWPTLGAGVVGAVTGWIPRAPFSNTMPWLPVEGNWQYGAGALGIAAVTVSTVLLTVLALPGPVRGRVVVLALPVVGLALVHNAGLSYPSTFVVLCLLVAPFAGLGLVRMRSRATAN